jgi:hypothetical protein
MKYGCHGQTMLDGSLLAEAQRDGIFRKSLHCQANA